MQHFHEKNTLSDTAFVKNQVMQQKNPDVATCLSSHIMCVKDLQWPESGQRNDCAEQQQHGSSAGHISGTHFPLLSVSIPAWFSTMAL